jgi:hypothetical protein
MAVTVFWQIAASILGASRTKAYALAKSGEFPVRLVRVGRPLTPGSPVARRHAHARLPRSPEA